MVTYTFSLVNFEFWLLIFVRIASFVFIAPIFGQSAIPNQAKIGFSFFVSFVLYHLVDPVSFDHIGIISYSMMIIKEVLTGLLIGYAANICNSIVFFAGNIIDMDIGLSMATEFNPEINSEVSMTGNIYYYFIMLLLMASDMHIYVLRAVCDSFQLIPLGGAEIGWDSLMSAMTQYIGDVFVIGFRIFLPFFACIMILNCILGVMVKVAPQLNMFSIGIQLKLLVGLVTLYLTIFLMPHLAEFIFDEIKTMVVMFIHGLGG